MKKQLFSILAVAAALVMGLSSCSKDDPSTPLNIELEKTATIQGTILYNGDVTKALADQKWSAPDAVTIIATLPYANLHTSAAGTYTIPSDKISYNKSTGEFTIIAPVGTSATTVTVKVCAFKGTLKKNVNGDDKTVDGVWSESTATASVKRGEVYYLAPMKKVEADFTDTVLDGSKVN